MKFVIAVFLSLFIVTPALAIDFTTVLTDLDGVTPLKDAFPLGESDPTKHPDLTLGLAAAHALTTDHREEQISGDEKRHRGDLAVAIFKAKDATLPAEDIALIKKLMPKLWAPIVIHDAWPLLDPAAK